MILRVAEYSAYAIVVMWILYVVGIQYLRGGLWRLLLPITAVAALLDVLLNYTLFAVMTWDFPRKNEWTFTQRLGRLVTYFNWQGKAARLTAKYLLDWVDPRGQHVYPKSQP